MTRSRLGVEHTRNHAGERRKAVEALVLDLMLDAEDGAGAGNLMARLMREAPAAGITADLLDKRRAKRGRK